MLDNVLCSILFLFIKNLENKLIKPINIYINNVKYTIDQL